MSYPFRLVAGFRTAALLLFISSAPISRASYDLVVTEILGADNPDTSAWMTFSARIQNNGDTPTPEGVAHGVSFWVDGEPVSWSDTWTGSLAPGEATVVTANSGPNPQWNGVWVATSGPHQVMAWLDDVNRMPDENDENNNTLSQAMNVATDEVLSVSVASSSGPNVGDSVYFTALVEGHNGDSAVHFRGAGVTFYLDGNLLCSSNALYVQPGFIVELDSRYRYIDIDGTPAMPNSNGVWTATPGTHTIEARTDGPSPGSQTLTFEVAEEEETGVPDLVVESIVADPQSEEVLFSATIRNTGSAPTPAGTVHGVSFWIDGQPVSWSDTFTESLAPGAAVTLTANWGPAGKATWTAESGSHTLEAWADDVNRIAGEESEDNNRTGATLAVP